MKKKIRSQLLKISFLAIVSTLVLSVFVFYERFKRQVFDDLKSYAGFVAAMAGSLEEGRLPDPDSPEAPALDVRITLILPDGQVAYDSGMDSAGLENHNDRPEIRSAREQGEGRIIRRSKTFSQRTFYYAVRLSDGSVLRVSKDSGSIWTVFFSALPVLLVLAVLLLVLCFILSKYLTKRLIQPLDDLVDNIGNPLMTPEYKELEPFVGALKEQREDILRSAAMRQEFTANVSHELKTPLTSISGYAELIETGIVEGEEAKRSAGEIRKNSRRLLSLINDIINLSELDDGVTLQLERIDLYEAAKQCMGSLRVNARKNDVELILLGSEAWINADRGMLDEVLYNLCDNAIRYNNRGGKVILDVSVTMDHKVKLVVKDNGIGIPKEHQERIFERFYRVDKSRSKETGGTGLGLAIVKHILMSHGAELSLESEAGKGTCITVTFEEAANAVLHGTYSV